MDQRMSRSGFYGKLASHGDFIGRRLSPAFLRIWDAWLQAALTSSRERLGHQWLPTYLCSPIWRFALASGVCGELSWAGVLMPSVDRVGRCFPLTLAYGGPPVSALQRLSLDDDWYAALETMALSTLDAHFCLSTFDHALFSLHEPSGDPHSGVQYGSTSAPAESWFEWPAGQDRQAWLASLELSEHSARALFWTDGSAQCPPSLLVSSGLPSDRAYVDMLSGGQPAR
ncbi:type VI secretion system protein ImpM [Pseudomonas reinekei]|uniref:Type VI secretion system protein ImpM n=2 Tax=Pseudomonas reinekei TaxID=395598 RepID=A0A1H0I313_PSERE|nr:type VI secretion system protein ImpM [Pseudomonas reinekei]